ncbi:MAG: hypothetical protein EXR99_13395 [Gemmataceae bacterium]|nr:hypothetical protein [Gemmataceae bacterium]
MNGKKSWPRGMVIVGLFFIFTGLALFSENRLEGSFGFVAPGVFPECDNGCKDRPIGPMCQRQFEFMHGINQAKL